VAGTLLSSGNTGTDEQEALPLKLLGPSDRVGVVGVTAVNDNVTLLEMGDELLNKGVNGRTGLDKENYFAWPFQFGSELLDGVGALDIGTYKGKRPRVRLC